jgi:hypothetical protein
MWRWKASASKWWSRRPFRSGLAGVNGALEGFGIEVVEQVSIPE